MRQSLCMAAFVALTVTPPTTLAGCGGSEGYAGIEVRDRRVAGHELRLVVETSRSYKPLLSHSSKTADAKGYLVTVDLSSSQPLADRAKVYGPLWDVANPRSSISFQAGANFTQEDVDAANATPACVFDADGTLLRFTRDPARHGMVRDAFVAAPGGGSWKRLGDVKSVDDRTEPMSEDRLETPSGRFVLLYQDGKAKLFDLFTGEQKDDPWLTTSFAHARSIKKLENLRMFVTEDLNHLVVSPMAIWNSDGTIYETFDLDGKTWKRGDVGLAYSRPDPKPVLFPRTLDDPEKWYSEAPHGALSIGGELYLFAYEELSLRLYRPDGSQEFRADADGGPVWPIHDVRQMQLFAEKGELVMIVWNEITDTSLRDRPEGVVRWKYRDATVTRFDTNVGDLFEKRDGQLHPKSVLPVK